MTTRALPQLRKNYPRATIELMSEHVASNPDNERFKEQIETTILANNAPANKLILVVPTSMFFQYTRSILEVLAKIRDQLKAKVFLGTGDTPCHQEYTPKKLEAISDLNAEQIQELADGITNTGIVPETNAVQDISNAFLEEDGIYHWLDKVISAT